MDYLRTDIKESQVKQLYGADGLRLLKTIYYICDRGSDVEIRRKKDGTFKVYEVRKKIAG